MLTDQEEGTLFYCSLYQRSLPYFVVKLLSVPGFHDSSQVSYLDVAPMFAIEFWSTVSRVRITDRAASIVYGLDHHLCRTNRNPHKVKNLVGIVAFQDVLLRFLAFT